MSELLQEREIRKQLLFEEMCAQFRRNPCLKVHEDSVRMKQLAEWAVEHRISEKSFNKAFEHALEKAHAAGTDQMLNIRDRNHRATFDEVEELAKKEVVEQHYKRVEGGRLFRVSPDIEEQIDRFIAENPERWKYIQGLPRERLERAYMLRLADEERRRSYMAHKTNGNDTYNKKSHVGCGPKLEDAESYPKTHPLDHINHTNCDK